MDAFAKEAHCHASIRSRIILHYWYWLYSKAEAQVIPNILWGLTYLKIWSHNLHSIQCFEYVIKYISVDRCIHIVYHGRNYTLFHFAHEVTPVCTSLGIPVNPVVPFGVHTDAIFTITSIWLTQIPFLKLKWASIGPNEPVIYVRI